MNVALNVRYLIVLAIGFSSCHGGNAQPRPDAIAKELQSAKSTLLKDPTSITAKNEIRRAAKSEYPFERMYAVATIGELGSIGAFAMPEILEALGSGDPFVEREAARAVGSIGRAASRICPDVVPALMDKLRRPESDVAWFAAESLGELGPDAVPSIAELREAAKSTNVNMRDSSRKSLKKLTGSEE